MAPMARAIHNPLDHYRRRNGRGLSSGLANAKTLTKTNEEVTVLAPDPVEGKQPPVRPGLFVFLKTLMLISD